MTVTQILACGAGITIIFMLYMFSRPKTRQPSLLKLSQVGDKSNVKSDVKVLNVIFQYNGHDFDAHQALGIPAGSSKEAARRAYETAVLQADPGGKEFLEHAYQSILKS